MRLNELTNLMVAALVGMVLGVVGTVGVYSAVSGKQADAERQEAADAVKQAQDERDEALARINDYLEVEQNKRLVAESPVGEVPVTPAALRPETAPPKRSETAATRVPETAPAPREQAGASPTTAPDAKATGPVPGFGPPRQSGSGN